MEGEIVYLDMSFEVRQLYAIVKERGTIGQQAQLQPEESYRFPLGAPEWQIDQWEAANDRLRDLVVEIMGI